MSTPLTVCGMQCFDRCSAILALPGTPFYPEDPVCIRSLSVLVGALCLLSLAAAASGGSAEAIPVKAKGVIVFLEGEVLLEESDAFIGQEVPLGVTIETGPDSFCEVIFDKRNIFRIREKCKAVLNIDEEHRRIDLHTGSVAFVFNRLQTRASRRGTFTVNTPTAVAGVRGTAVFIKVESAGSTYVCTCNGSLTLNDALGGGARQVESKLHKAYRYSRKGESISTERAPLLYHDNASMDALSAKIGYRIRWGDKSPDGGY